jgi:hypothetical protein
MQQSAPPEYFSNRLQIMRLQRESNSDHHQHSQTCSARFRFTRQRAKGKTTGGFRLKNLVSMKQASAQREHSKNIKSHTLFSYHV